MGEPIYNVMNRNTRILLNALATYGRSVFGLVLGLFSTRWILKALGQTDFGLYGVVGALIVFVGFLNNVSSSSISRFYAYSIGYGKTVTNEEAVADLKKWFNTALSVHLLVPILLVAVGYPIGVYAVRHWLVIPPDRVEACVWVLRFAMGSMFVSMVSLPYIAMYSAHQLIVELSFFGILHTLWTFGGACYLMHASGDRLVQYALIMFLSFSVIPLIQVIRAYCKFPACRLSLRLFFKFDCLKSMFGFAGWQLFGGIGGIMRGEGVAVLVNLFFGPKVNAAFGIANQVSAQTQTLSTALLGAISPAVTTEEGAGNREGMVRLAFRSCKFGVLLILVFAIPLIIEMSYVLHLWLGEVPPHVASFCIAMIGVLIIDKLTFGHMVAITAQGRIAAYQVTLGIFLMLTLPICWVMIKLGCGPISVCGAYLISVTLCLWGRLFYCKRQLNMSRLFWCRHVLLPIVGLAALSFGSGFAVHVVMCEGFARLVVVTLTTLLVTSGLCWYMVLDENEKSFLHSSVNKILKKVSV